jgi:F0F1-type ATP synthase assembly protein I
MGASRDGSDQVWGLISTLVAGPAVWGAIGYGVDRSADTTVFTPVGVVIGFVAGFYIVYVKATQDGRSAPRTRGSARLDQGDSR